MEAAQREVWEAARARFDAWAQNDYDAFQASTHDRWRRWSMRSAGLMEKADYARFWDDFKGAEEIVSFTLEPVAIEIFGDGDVAVIHSHSEETLVPVQGAGRGLRGVTRPGDRSRGRPVLRSGRRAAARVYGTEARFHG